MGAHTAVAFKEELICVRLRLVERKRAEEDRARKGFLLTDRPWVCVCVQPTMKCEVKGLKNNVKNVEQVTYKCWVSVAKSSALRHKLKKEGRGKGASERQWLMTTEGQSRGRWRGGGGRAPRGESMENSTQAAFVGCNQPV